jgi:hypothetical protein
LSGERQYSTESTDGSCTCSSSSRGKHDNQTKACSEAAALLACQGSASTPQSPQTAAADAHTAQQNNCSQGLTMCGGQCSKPAIPGNGASARPTDDKCSSSQQHA